MTKQPNKKKFEVLENETITDCLARMEQRRLRSVSSYGRANLS